MNNPIGKIYPNIPVGSCRSYVQESSGSSFRAAAISWTLLPSTKPQDASVFHLLDTETPYNMHISASYGLKSGPTGASKRLL